MKTANVIIIFIYFVVDVTAVNYSVDIQTYYTDILHKVVDQTKCVTQIKHILNGIHNLELWPLFFADASAKLQPSLLTGNIHLLGGYDECMDINVKKDNDEIQGQYCRTAVTISSSMNKCMRQKFNELEITGLGKTTLDEVALYQIIYYDVCVPADCSATNLQRIWNVIENTFNLTITVIFEEEYCTTLEKQNTYSLLDLVVMTVFSTIALIVVSSTIYDLCIFQKYNDNDTCNIFMAFSFYTNGKRLFSVKDDKSNIACVNGIRVISIAWIILGHRTLLNFTGDAINAAYAFEWFKHPENMFIMGAFPCVNTFFLLSGFLTIYVTMTLRESGLKINIFVFYLHRILRLTPALAAILLLHLGVVNHLGSGPYWFYVEELVTKRCRENWWSVLLYVQNYVSPWSGCITQTWYLAADTQLYFISPLIVLPLLKWTKSTIVLIIALSVASNAHAVYLIYYYELDGVSYSAIKNYWEYLYLPSHLRITPWLVGLVLGFYMFLSKNKKISIKKRYIILFWVIAILLFLVVMYGYVLFPNIKFTLLEASIFTVVAPIFWSIGVGWVLYACERGYGGFINDFLSIPIFTILARLSYSMFLTHFTIIMVMVAQKRTNSFIYNLTQFHDFWGDYAFCVGLSVIWTLTFESPITILEKTLLNRSKVARKNPIWKMKVRSIL